VDDFGRLLDEQVHDMVRTKLAKVDLDHAFLLRHDLQQEVEARLGAVVHEYGFVVVKALVTHFMPAATVVATMSNIYTQALQKQVTAVVADTRKMTQVIMAEAESERKELLGKGTSLMRRAYLDGMQQCLDDFVVVSPVPTDADPRHLTMRPAFQAMESEDFVLTFEDVLYLQLLLQYFDSLRATSRAPHSPADMPCMALSLDPTTIAALKSRLTIGHYRGSADGPKKPRTMQPVPDLREFESTRAGISI
jgi:hypothetical protein